MKLVAKCVFLCAALVGCSSSEPKFYTLERVVGPSEAAGVATLQVGRPGLAGYLDRSEIVLENDSYRISTSDQDRWAEPLGDMIGRVLTQNLAQRLKNTSVYDQSGAITATPDARVEVNVTKLDVDKSGSMALNAEIAVEQGSTHRAIASRHVELQTNTPSLEPAVLVATMSTLLGIMSDRIASDVHSSTEVAAAPPHTPVAVSTAAPAVPATPANIAVASADMPAAAPAVIPLMAAPAGAAIAAPLAILPAPVTNVSAHPLAPANCQSGGRAVPCLQAP